MRDRPFIPASEPSRPYSEIRAERAQFDPREAALRMIADIEAEAAELTDPAARILKQCEAEDIRRALDEIKR